MATLIAKTIGTGGDYASTTTFEAALPADLTVSDEIWQGTFIDPSGGGGATWTGTVCDDTRYIVLRGSRPFAYAGPWGAYRAGARNGVTTLSGASIVMYIQDCNFYGSGASGVAVTGTSAKVYCSRVGMFGCDTNGSGDGGFVVNAAGAILECNWCFSVDSSADAGDAGFECTAGTLTCRNCTHVGYGNGFLWVAGTMACTNCYSASVNGTGYTGTMTLVTCHSNDTTAASVGGAGNTQITLANAGFKARRHPSLVAYVHLPNYAATGNQVPGKHGTDFPGVLVGSRYTSTASQTSPGVSAGDAADSATSGFTGTTGYKAWPAVGGTIKMPLGTGDRSIVARIQISEGPATNAIRGILWVWDESTANDTFRLSTDASGYFVVEVTDASGDSTTATSTTKIGDLADGVYMIVGSLAGNTLSIRVFAENAALPAAEGTGDATGKVTFTSPIAATRLSRGYYTTGGSHYYLGAAVRLLSGSGIFNDDITPTGQLDTFRDNEGWNWDLDLTEASAELMKTGGTAWATPGTDLLGRTVGEKFPIGACMYDNKAAHVGKGRYSHNQSGGGSGWRYYR